MSILIPPYGGSLVDLLKPGDAAAELARHASMLPSITLSERASCDLELLATGRVFAARLLHGAGRLRARRGRDAPGGWNALPDPVTLSVAERSEPGGEVPLRGSDNALLAVMTVEEVFEWDVDAVAAT